MLTTPENPSLNHLQSTSSMPNILRAKCIVAGDATVGKSCIVQAFVSESSNFQKNYVMTCGVDIRTKKVSVPDTNDVVELYMYDSSGKDLYFDFLMQLWNNPSMLCIVFDVTNEKSFKSCSHWLDSLRKTGSELNIPGVLIGNKVDLVKRRVVFDNEASEFARQNGLVYFESSTKENRGIEEPFFYLVNEWHKSYLEKSEIFKTS